MRCLLTATAMLVVTGTLRADELDDLREQVATLQAEASKLREARDILLDKVVNLGDRVNQLQTQVVEAEETRQQLVAKAAFEKLKAERHGLGQWDLWLVDPVKAVVTATDEKQIEISAGSDDGVKEGSEVTITRAERTIGGAIVTKVTANRSIVKLKVPTVRKGDQVVWPDRVPGIDDDLREGAIEDMEDRKKQWRKFNDAIQRKPKIPNTSGS